MWKIGSLEDQLDFCEAVQLQASFEDLPFDKFMNPEHFGTRKRRFGRFEYNFDTDKYTQLSNVPYVPRFNNHNQYQNGVPRMFEPLAESTANNPILGTAMKAFASKLPASFKKNHAEIKIQQIRIIADERTNCAQPTPEGIHRDGETFIGVIIVNRTNVSGGEVTVYNRTGTDVLGSFISQPWEGYLIDDRETMHCVSAIRAVDSSKLCCRDVFIFNFNVLQEVNEV